MHRLPQSEEVSQPLMGMGGQGGRPASGEEGAEASATSCPVLPCDVPTISLTAQSKAEVGGLFIPAPLFIHLLFMQSCQCILFTL